MDIGLVVLGHLRSCGLRSSLVTLKWNEMKKNVNIEKVCFGLWSERFESLFAVVFGQKFWAWKSIENLQDYELERVRNMRPDETVENWPFKVVNEFFQKKAIQTKWYESAWLPERLHTKQALNVWISAQLQGKPPKAICCLMQVLGPVHLLGDFSPSIHTKCAKYGIPWCPPMYEFSHNSRIFVM
jgi:hypothetical protein